MVVPLGRRSRGFDRHGNGIDEQRRFHVVRSQNHRIHFSSHNDNLARRWFEIRAIENSLIGLRIDIRIALRVVVVVSAARCRLVVRQRFPLFLPFLVRRPFFVGQFGKGHPRFHLKTHQRRRPSHHTVPFLGMTLLQSLADEQGSWSNVREALFLSDAARPTFFGMAATTVVLTQIGGGPCRAATRFGSVRVHT